MNSLIQAFSRARMESPVRHTLWGWKPIWLVWVALACVAVMVVGFFAHSRIAAPMERKLAAAQALVVAKDLDNLVAARSAAINMAAQNLEIDTLVASGGLDRILKNLREMFSDFQSLEIISDQGQVLAMMGELPPASNPVDFKPEKFAASVSVTSPNQVLFEDDPAHGCFFVILKHPGMDEGPWYSRTRFSRHAMTAALTQASRSLEAQVLAVAGNDPVSRKALAAAGSQSPFGSDELAGTTTSTSGWWRRTVKAEALAAPSGLAISVQKSFGGSSLLSAGLAAPIFMLALMVLAYGLRRAMYAHDNRSEAVIAEPWSPRTALADQPLHREEPPAAFPEVPAFDPLSRPLVDLSCIPPCEDTAVSDAAPHASPEALVDEERSVEEVAVAGGCFGAVIEVGFPNDPASDFDSPFADRDSDRDTIHQPAKAGLHDDAPADAIVASDEGPAALMSEVPDWLEVVWDEPATEDSTQLPEGSVAPRPDLFAGA